MAKYLVIVESPSKATKIAQYLGKDYYVMASKGHIADLPSKGLNVDLKKNFKPHYEVMEDKVDVVAKIVSEAKKAQAVYLMSDPDREGEAIAWLISQQLPSGTQFFRAKTNSITDTAVKQAIDEADQINMDLVDAFEARRILDRLVGYKCSYLTQSATGGKSAGRVQSAALRALSDREKEIKSFVPQEYWDIGAELLTTNKDKIWTRLTKPEKMDVSNEDKAKQIVAALTKKTAVVSKYDTKEVFSSPYAPFTTSSLQQTAATILGWSQDKTMSVAQALYENSFITYMRTDSPYIEPGTISALRTEIQTRYGKKYLPDKANFYASKAKNAQEAHEAIRPTHVEVEQIDELESDHKKLYKMIWQRTVASQMERSKSLGVSARFTVGSYELGANGSSLLFDGWKKVWHYALSDDTLLPVLNIGDKCDIIDVSSEQKFTQPPSRYTKSSITKLYEETGIGRPSTYASITKTLLARKYIELLKNSYQVTDLGLKVSDFLQKSGFCFIDLDFTSKMEEKLDRITNKEAKKIDTLTEFWDRLQKDITNAKTLKVDASQTNFPCPKCKNMLALKHSKFGAFFGCTDKKECGYTAIVGPDGEPKEKPPKEYGSEPCQLCGSKMVKRNSKMGGFFGCEKFPSCRGMRNLQGEVIEQKKTEGKKPWKKWKKS
jgi:DNA topoisomerase-1